MPETDTSTSFFMNAHRPGFGPFTDADDLLHREVNSHIADPALTETQFLGFSVPAAGVHALNYLWVHPNLELLTGGVWAWQGVKRHRVDGYTVRDRSWGEVRPENPRPVPPLHWVTGVFSDDFAFHMMGLEDPSAHPTRWSLDTGYPAGHTLQITDTSGFELTLSGTITASCSWNTWSNVNMLISLCRWEHGGAVAWGDRQVATWTDFVHRCLPATG